MTTTDTLKQKRQYFHQLLIALGEEKYKDVIVSSAFGVESTQSLTEAQMDRLIAEARARLNQSQKPQSSQKNEATLRRWRNKCLLVLNERGIMATPKDWTAVNAELAKKQFQWILTDEQRNSGLVNKKGLYAFTTADDLKKLFLQLAAIRDAERDKNKHLRKLAANN